MWAVGVVLANLLCIEDIFNSDFEEDDDRVEILDQVFGLLGAPSHENAPCILKYPKYEQ
jgi:hypothetical protein